MWTSICIWWQGGTCLGVELLGHDNSVSLFEGPPNVFPQQLYHFHSLRQCMRVSVSPQPYQHLFTLFLGKPSAYKVVPHCGFDLHLPNN